MTISTFSRYGLRALLRMSIMLNENGEKPVSLKIIAEKENISLKYLENIFSVLRKNNIITAKRGKFGGYVLSKPANETNIYTILNILEGNLSLSNCLIDKIECANEPDACIIRPFWKEINEMIVSKLKSKSLGDLVKDTLSK